MNPFASIQNRFFKALENFPTPRADIDQLRAEVLREVSGLTVEIGFGTGLNLPHLPGTVREYVGIDPEPQGGPLTDARLKQARFPVMLVKAPAENLPFQDATFDSAVMTWTLCSLSQPEAALRELHRVLKPGGRLFFIEHGRAPGTVMALGQKLWTPVQARIADGCHVDRAILSLIEGAGFNLDTINQNYLRGPRPLTYTYRGLAIRP